AVQHVRQGVASFDEHRVARAEGDSGDGLQERKVRQECRDPGPEPGVEFVAAEPLQRNQVPGGGGGYAAQQLGVGVGSRVEQHVGGRAESDPATVGDSGKVPISRAGTWSSSSLGVGACTTRGTSGGSTAAPLAGSSATAQVSDQSRRSRSSTGRSARSASVNCPDLVTVDQRVTWSPEASLL